MTLNSKPVPSNAWSGRRKDNYRPRNRVQRKSLVQINFTNPGKGRRRNFPTAILIKKKPTYNHEGPWIYLKEDCNPESKRYIKSEIGGGSNQKRGEQPSCGLSLTKRSRPRPDNPSFPFERPLLY